MLSDALVVVVGYYGALLIRLIDPTPTPESVQELARHVATLNTIILPLVVLYVGVNYLRQLHRRAWRYASAQEVFSIFGATALTTALVAIADTARAAPWRPFPLSIVLLGGFFTFSGFVAVRYRSRLLSGLVWRWKALWGRFPPTSTRTLIFGAGETGQLLAWRLQNQNEGRNYRLVGFIDDDPRKRGLRVHGVRVLGGRAELAQVVDREKADLIILAMANVSGSDLRAIVSACQETAARINITPNVFESISRLNGAPLLREINVEDLLGRNPLSVDQSACETVVARKSVLVTGGCGSIGSELCRQIAGYAPRRLLVLDNNETGLYDLEIELRTRLPALDLEVLVGDVTDDQKMDAVFAEFRPQTVFHVAAYKHVPLMERYPEEAVRVNVLGTQIAVDKADRYGAERFVLVSTDKAVNPRSVMGATKRVAELVALSMNATSSCLYAIVRFGNVLGSRGSVVPTFAKQIELGGPVTVTHREATRFFMETSEAASLIIHAASLTQGGDIFMLEMGERIRVDDLARRMIRMRGLRPGVDIQIEYVGLRPGEKLHEELMCAEEERQPTSYPHIHRFMNGHPAPEPHAVREATRELLDLARRGTHEQLISALLDLVSAGPGRDLAPPVKASL
jgi:FlaA1/EpsC-like NDP-sugar epimerase